MKNVLVIGNGYDKAHGLKTSYNDFLSFIRNFKPGDYEVPDIINTEFSKLILSNPFLLYLLDYEATLNTWVDFENELKRITYAIRDFFMNPSMDECRQYSINADNLQAFTLKVLEQFGFIAKNSIDFSKRPIQPMYYDPIYKVHWDKIKIKLRKDLDGLKRALVVYLKYYMPLISNDEGYCIKQLADINPQYVFSFNYTDTYRRYGIDNKKNKLLHIHGDLDAEKIVLGYDDEDKDDLTLVAYKKYFQRIQYQFRRINKSVFATPGEKAGDVDLVPDTVVHIYGLSLDKTDEDIIKQIYQLAIKLVIYYLVREDGDMSDYENKIVNLIGILGKDDFLNALEMEKIVFREIDSTRIDEHRCQTPFRY